MKRKITVVGLIAAVVAVVAVAAAFATSGGELPANRTAGHVVIGAPGSEVEGGDPGSTQIDVESYSWGVSNTLQGGGGPGGGGGSGVTTVEDLTIVKTIDKASPLLARKCAIGEHIPQVVLTVYRPGGSNAPYMEYKMSDVTINKVQQSGSGNSIPLEAVTFTFDTIELKYTTRDGEVVQTTIAQPQ
jgi:type VI secretion system secreted protein Hcp